MDGLAGKDLIVKVPCGTLVWRRRDTTPPIETKMSRTDDEWPDEVEHKNPMFSSGTAINAVDACNRRANARSSGVYVKPPSPVFSVSIPWAGCVFAVIVAGGVPRVSLANTPCKAETVRVVPVVTV